MLATEHLRAERLEILKETLRHWVIQLSGTKEGKEKAVKKLINAPSTYVDEALDGLCAAYSGYRRTGRGGRVIARADGGGGRVGVVTGGGFGHLPVFAGYVGQGMLSACAVGEVFAGPPADICLDAIRAADEGEGVLCLLANYGGDRMSFAQACDDYEEVVPQRTLTVVIADDVASAPFEQRSKRRGVAGMVFAFKTAGAAAARGAVLADVADVAARTARRTRSMGVALSPCLIPGAAKPGFDVSDGMMEIGMGIHGEPGVAEQPLSSADAVTADILGRLLADAPADSKRAAILINSLGATPLEELLIVYRKATAVLDAAGISINRRYVGHYATSMEMAGLSISLLFLDDEIDTLLGAPTSCPFWPRG